MSPWQCFTQTTSQDAPTPPPPPTFSTVTEDQVAKIIMNSPSKSCSLDSWSTFIVLDYLDILITPINSIIRGCLEQSKCPNFFKQALVSPCPQKIILRQEKIVKTYRPVSNLNVILKILERVVAVQLQTHSDEAGLMTAFPSAYIENTILLKVPSLIFITIFFSIWPKGVSQPIPFGISPQHLMPLTTPFFWTDLMFTMESVN